MSITQEQALIPDMNSWEARARVTIDELRNASNWLRQGYGSWKDCASEYSRAPKTAADLLEEALNARQYIQQSAQAAPVQAEQAAAKSLNAKAADLLRPYLKPGQKVIWREAFRWHDDNGVLPNHYEGQEVEVLSDNFGYGWAYDTNLKHAAIVWDRAAATQPQQAKESGNA